MKGMYSLTSFAGSRRTVKHVLQTLQPRSVVVLLVFGLALVWFSYEQLTVKQHVPVSHGCRKLLFASKKRQLPSKQANVSGLKCTPWAIRNNPSVILAYVQSSAFRAHRRYVIRKTWGRRWKNRIQPLFTIGRHDSHVMYPESLLDLESESCEFGDILYIPDVTDHRDNLALMEVRGRIWIVEHVPWNRYVLRVEDDFTINETLWMKESQVLLDSVTSVRNGSSHACAICKLWRNNNLTGSLEDWTDAGP